MSSHPQDSQPPEDNHSDILNSADDDDFWNLDDSDDAEFAIIDDNSDVSATDISTSSEHINTTSKSNSYNNQEPEKPIKIEASEIEASSTLEADENKDFWDLNNQYDSFDLDENDTFAAPEEDFTENSESSTSVSAIEPTNSKTSIKDSKDIVSQISSSTVISSPTVSSLADTQSQNNQQKAEQNKVDSGEPDLKDRRTPFELVSTLICYLGIVALFAYLINYASKQHDFDTEPSFATNVPVSGEFASIVNIEAWWEKPSNTTKVKYGVILIPVAKITLGDDAKSGSIRTFFFNPANELIDREAVRKGDSITSEFRDGKFLETGTNEITIYATDGFEEEAHYNYYRSQDDERWTIQIREAGSNQTSTNDFKYLAQAPIEPVTK